MTVNLKSEYSYEVNSEEWNNKLLQNKVSTIYQTDHWQKIYKQAYDSKPIFITVTKPNGEILGQLSGVIHKNLFWENTNTIISSIGKKLNLRTTLNWFYGPIIHDYNFQNEIISEILSCIDTISVENKVIMIRGISPSLDEELMNESFKHFDYTLDPWATYITNLNQTSEKLHESLNKKTRYDIRKSEQQELKFEIAKNKKDYDEFTELKIESRNKAGQKIKSNPLFFDIHRELLFKQGFEKLFIVRHDGKIIGGILGVIFNGNIIQHGVGNYTKTDLLGGSFLTWNSLKWAIKEGYSTFDMGGINPFPKSLKEKKIDFYKSKWGGKKFNYTVYTKILDKKKIMLSSFLKNPKNASKKLKHRFNL